MMKSIIVFVVAVIATTVAQARPIDQLITAIGQVESDGNDNAVKQQCYGYLQVRQICIDDVNQCLGTSYTVKDVLGNRALSIKIFKTYMKMYATKDNIGRTPTNEDRARIWNGGPTGWRKDSTMAYWAKVRKRMS